ncbi:MAG TPA: TIGR03619 family F420-dependent LLM class oxidoreductase [Acidimicrobiia bacterium]|nr:TIGR03619 family F420-dependent LLM class oxidoreductase [Acidimicrobiia bacterium]
MSTVSVVPEGVLAYGMQLPVQALSVRVSMPWEREGTVEDMARVAQACDTAGFLYVAVCHHVAIPPEPAEMMSTQWFDPIATLGYLAARTTRTRLMTNVFIAAYQPPLATAKAFATLDRLSNGRLIVGIGAGHVEGEFDALGVSFAGRGRLADRALEIISAALTDEWTDPGSGRVGQRPRPVQRPHPPIWIGGSGKPALRRVATMADGWIPQATPLDQLPADIETILRERDRVRPGAVPEIGYHLVAHVGEPTWELPKGVMHGSPDRIAEFANKRLGAIGVSHLQVRLYARDASEQCDQIAAFGAEVGPHLVRTPLA